MAAGQGVGNGRGRAKPLEGASDSGQRGFVGFGASFITHAQRERREGEGKGGGEGKMKGGGGGYMQHGQQAHILDIILTIRYCLKSMIAAAHK